jgi:hypothetical protein
MENKDAEAKFKGGGIKKFEKTVKTSGCYDKLRAELLIKKESI